MSLSSAYLKYLRDVSRKMVFRAGFDVVFPGTARNPDCLSLSNETRTKPWFTKISDEAKKADRKVFLGLGTITGKLRQANGRLKKIAAPIFFAQASVDEENLRLIIDKESLSLNYDIVQYLINNRIDDEKAEGVDFSSPDLISLHHLLDGITDRVSRLDIPSEVGVAEFRIHKEQLTELIKSCLADFKSINSHFVYSEIGEVTSSKELRNIAHENSLLVSFSCFFFSGKFPDHLSTYTALNHLTKQIENTKVENPLIESLLRAAFENQSIDLSNESPSQEEIRQAIKFIPFTLSERQKNSLYYAWEKKVSYIQGPPGTGKSHTIAAIMLTALFLGKKVLLVSQKKAAIDVVQRKLQDLCGGQDALIFISEKTEVKNLLRERLSTILQEVGHDYDHRKLDSEKKKNNELREQIDKTRAELAVLRTQIKSMIDVQRDFYQTNSRFLILRDNFVQTFQTGKISFLDILPDSASKWEKKLIKIGRARGNKITPHSIIQLKATKKKALKSLGATTNHLDILNPKFELYLNQLLACTKEYNITASMLKFTRTADDVNNFRESYHLKLNELVKLQEKYLASTQWLFIRQQLQNRLQRENLDSFRAMLRNVDPVLIQGKMDGIDYAHLTNVFPLWAGLIRDLGSYLRFDPQIFDLVIVDESSQVNIAEVLPAFYRSKSICVVGDRKQLGLNAAGLFSLNRQFEDMAWNSHFSRRYSLKDGDDKGLLVSKHSILEFITNPNNNLQPPSSTLNEHFRSAPKLAEFTSQKFYSDEGGLKVMTLVADKVTQPCFKAINVDALREQGEKLVQKEIDAAFGLLNDLIRKKSWKTDTLLRDNFIHKFPPSIGILSFTTDQNIAINDRLRDEYTDEEIKEYHILAGTTEEFQGNERSIMMLVLGADNTLTTSAQFYNDARRVNVATSRAINFTYLIYGGIPSNFGLLQSYLKFFDVPIDELNQPLKLVEKYYNWKFTEENLASEFEVRIYQFLIEFLAKEYPGQPWKVFNQVRSCGKFLDFVLFNPVSSRALAVEVDGPDHYQENTIDYTDTHLEREQLLLRAGWDIVHIPYYKWYNRGWLADRSNQVFIEYLKKITMEFKRRIEHAPLVN